MPSQHADGTVYITQRGREDDDFAAYIYKSTDYGKTFTSIVNNIPAGPVNVIREDPRDPNVLYVGTDFGVYVSTNGGAKWDVLGGNLPSVQVSDLQFQKRDNIMVISTYGRGMWVFDAIEAHSAGCPQADGDACPSVFGLEREIMTQASMRIGFYLIVVTLTVESPRSRLRHPSGD